MKDQTKPQQVTDFAKEYENVFRELTQYKSAYQEFVKERDQWRYSQQVQAKTAEEVTNNAFEQYWNKLMDSVCTHLKLSDDEAFSLRCHVSEIEHDEFADQILNLFTFTTSAKSVGLNLGKLQKDVDNLIASSTKESYEEAFEEIDKSVEVVITAHDFAQRKSTWPVSMTLNQINWGANEVEKGFLAGANWQQQKQADTISRMREENEKLKAENKIYTDRALKLSNRYGNVKFTDEFQKPHTDYVRGYLQGLTEATSIINP